MGNHNILYEQGNIDVRGKNMSTLRTGILRVSKQIETDINALGWFIPVIKKAKQEKATDICIVENKPVRISILKDYRLIEPIIKPSQYEIDELVEQTLPPDTKDMSFLLYDSANVNNNPNYFEYGFSIKDFGRFRVSHTNSEEGRVISLRKLPYAIPSIEELDRFNFLKGIKNILNFKQMIPSGLILHTGITGSGKSTMIAAEIDYIATKISGNILVFENPIEYRITMRKANVIHYEVNRHINSFLEGMNISLRNNPSVIMVGEVRTREEIQTLFEIANKGHLVFSTLHTNNVMNTIRFLTEVGEDKGSWRHLIAHSLRAIVSQKLMFRNDDYVLIAEVFIPDKVARAKIAEGNYVELENLISSNQLKDNGTVTFKHAFEELVRSNVLSERDRKELFFE
ncbi:MAG: Flp pilus assembly complex ATPase component TadA [Nitrospirae bacterium]|nr:Flp pilus assembly complex ATPase component TadA [Nitrospirota bacterium]